MNASITATAINGDTLQNAIGELAESPAISAEERAMWEKASATFAKIAGKGTSLSDIEEKVVQYMAQDPEVMQTAIGAVILVTNKLQKGIQPDEKGLAAWIRHEHHTDKATGLVGSISRDIKHVEIPRIEELQQENPHEVVEKGWGYIANKAGQVRQFYQNVQSNLPETLNTELEKAIGLLPKNAELRTQIADTVTPEQLRQTYEGLNKVAEALEMALIISLPGTLAEQVAASTSEVTKLATEAQDLLTPTAREEDKVAGLELIKSKIVSGKIGEKLLNGEELSIDDKRQVFAKAALSYARYSQDEAASDDPLSAESLASRLEKDGSRMTSFSDEEINTHFAKVLKTFSNSVVIQDLVDANYTDAYEAVENLEKQEKKQKFSLNGTEREQLKALKYEAHDGSMRGVRLIMEDEFARRQDTKARTSALEFYLQTVTQNAAKWEGSLSPEYAAPNLSGIDLAGINLAGMDLSSAKGVTAEQLAHARNPLEAVLSDEQRQGAQTLIAKNATQICRDAHTHYGLDIKTHADVVKIRETSPAYLGELAKAVDLLPENGMTDRLRGQLEMSQKLVNSYYRSHMHDLDHSAALKVLEPVIEGQRGAIEAYAKAVGNGTQNSPETQQLMDTHYQANKGHIENATASLSFEPVVKTAKAEAVLPVQKKEGIITRIIKAVKKAFTRCFGGGSSDEESGKTPVAILTPVATPVVPDNIVSFPAQSVAVPTPEEALKPSYGGPERRENEALRGAMKTVEKVGGHDAVANLLHAAENVSQVHNASAIDNADIRQAVAKPEDAISAAKAEQQRERSNSNI